MSDSAGNTIVADVEGLEIDLGSEESADVIKNLLYATSVTEDGLIELMVFEDGNTATLHMSQEVLKQLINRLNHYVGGFLMSDSISIKPETLTKLIGGFEKIDGGHHLAIAALADEHSNSDLYKKLCQGRDDIADLKAKLNPTAVL